MSDTHASDPDPRGLSEAECQKIDSLTAMATGIAHELNNHLAAVEGNNKLLLRLIESESDFYPYLKRIQTATQQALDLTSELGVYAGRLEPDKRSVALGTMIPSLLPKWQEVASHKHDLKIDVPDNCPTIQADEDLLAGAITRLLANAQEATIESNGTVTVAVNKENLSQESYDAAYAENPPTGGSYVTISVQDTGNGISSSVRRRMFDPFFSTKLRGQGMGLPFVMGVARAHNGTVSFNTGSQGTTVRIHLPIDQ